MAELHLKIDGYIGESMFEDEQTVSLKGIEAKTEGSEYDEIIMHINSGGGDALESFAIYDHLNTLPVKITTIIKGLCGSGATIIALAADKVIALPNSKWFVHRASGGGFGESEQVRSTADLLDDIDEQMIDVYAAKTGKTRAKIRKWLIENKFFTATEAHEAGFIDEILEPAEAPESLMKYERPAMYINLNFYKQNPKILAMAKEKKSLFAQTRKLLGLEEVTPTADIEITLSNAKKAVVKSEAVMPAEGDEMLIDGKPAEDGQHLAAGEHEGTKYTTKDGVITNIEEPVIETQEEEEEEEEDAPTVEDAATASIDAKQLADTISAAIKAANAPIMAELQALKKGTVTANQVNSVNTAVGEIKTTLENHRKAIGDIMASIESDGFKEFVKGANFDDDKDFHTTRANASAEDIFKANLAKERNGQK